MTFEELYNKVVDMECEANFSPLNVVVADECGYKIVKDISVETSPVDGVGKFVLISTKDFHGDL